MAYWLMKSEPDVFGWPDLKAKPVEEWHGVRNYAARNNMRAMKLGDLAFFYHSNIGKEIVGIMRVVKLAHPDSTAEPKEDGTVIWDCVDVVADTDLPRPVSMEDVKREPRLKDMILINNSRLSVQPVTAEEWAVVCQMGGIAKPPKAG